MVRRVKGKAVTGSTNSQVEVLLAEKVTHLGEQGDIVRVKTGLRTKLSSSARIGDCRQPNTTNVWWKFIEPNKSMPKKIESRICASSKDDVENYSVTVEANANEEGHLYGSVIDSDISRMLKQAGYDVAPEQIKARRTTQGNSGCTP